MSESDNQVESDHRRTRGRGPPIPGVLGGPLGERFWTSVPRILALADLGSTLSVVDCPRPHLGPVLLVRPPPLHGRRPGWGHLGPITFGASRHRILRAYLPQDRPATSMAEDTRSSTELVRKKVAPAEVMEM